MVQLAVGLLNELSIYIGNIPVKPKAKTTAIPSVQKQAESEPSNGTAYSVIIHFLSIRHFYICAAAFSRYTS